MAVARYVSNGTLDSTFGSSGKAIVDFSLGNDEAHGVSVLSDGRILLVGSSDCCNGGGTDFALARLLPNGAMDNSFGPNADGQAHISFSDGSPASASAVAVDGDGRAVLVGGAYDDYFAL